MAKNILIISLTRMGDLIQTTPLIKGLRKKHPSARITLMVSSDFADAVSLIPDIDESVVFNLRQFKDTEDWEDKSWVKIYQYIELELNKIRDQSFDLLVNLSHSRFSALMVHYLKIKNVIGFHCNGSGDRMTGHSWMQYFGTEPFNRNYNEFNLVEIFSRSGGVDPSGMKINVLDASNGFNLNELIVPYYPSHNDEIHIGFQIGSSLENRRWSTQSFAKLADSLVESLNARILLFGVASESASANETIQLANHKDQIIDLTGKTDLKQLTGILKQCQYLVTNDTGTMHLAAALDTKIIGLFFAHAHPFETAPYSPGHLIFQARIPCAPCSYGVHCNNIVCVEKVLPDHILSVIKSHMENEKWVLPNSLNASSEVNVYETVLSSSGIIQLKPLIKHKVEIDDIFRFAYSVLWRETLDQETRVDFTGVSFGSEIMEDYNCSDFHAMTKGLSQKVSLLEEMETLGKAGMQICENIVRISSGERILPVKLVKFGEDINHVDEKIDLLGMANPELKPIANMFSKRKENLDGSDISRLGIESRNCYKLLNNESRRLIEILSDLEQQISTSLSPGYNRHNSIKVAVPGR